MTHTKIGMKLGLGTGLAFLAVTALTAFTRPSDGLLPEFPSPVQHQPVAQGDSGPELSRTPVSNFGWLVRAGSDNTSQTVLVPDRGHRWEVPVQSEWQRTTLAGRPVLRFTVPGGWLISMSTENVESWRFFFLPDAGHLWQVEQSARLILATNGFSPQALVMNQ